jgi:RimJ/RimL family protein N-acetyltransferase
MKNWTTTFETERLLLRPWRESDRAPFAAMNADAEVMRYFAAPLTEAASNALIDWNLEHFARHGFGLYAAEVLDKGDFAGFIGLTVPSFIAEFTPCVEIGWRLARRFWGRGLATEGAREVLRYALGDGGLPEVVSFTTESNAASRRVMEKLGMTHDRTDDFDHPRIPEGHPLRRHVLYRISGRKQAPP